jgi:hypothetical protein
MAKFFILLISLFLHLSSNISSYSLPYHPLRQTGPTCLITAVLMSISVREKTLPSQQEVARQVPVYPYGIQPYDLMVTLESMGWQSLSFIAPAQAASRLIEAGFSPIALIKKPDGSKHAVSVVGFQKEPLLKDQSLKLTHLQIADPNAPQAQWLSIEVFQAMHQDQHFLIFFKEAERTLLSVAGFPTAIAIQLDRQFRKTALILKANEHQSANPQKQSLLEQALSYDPNDESLKQQILEITKILMPSTPTASPHL